MMSSVPCVIFSGIHMAQSCKWFVRAPGHLLKLMLPEPGRNQIIVQGVLIHVLPNLTSTGQVLAADGGCHLAQRCQRSNHTAKCSSGRRCSRCGTSSSSGCGSRRRSSGSGSSRCGSSTCGSSGSGSRTCGSRRHSSAGGSRRHGKQRSIATLMSSQCSYGSVPPPLPTHCPRTPSTGSVAASTWATLAWTRGGCYAMLITSARLSSGYMRLRAAIVAQQHARSDAQTFRPQKVCFTVQVNRDPPVWRRTSTSHDVDELKFRLCP